MKVRKVKQMLIVALVACAGILASNAAAFVASAEKEFALLPPVMLTGLSSTVITNGQTLADSTISGTAIAIGFGDVAGTFTWDSPTTAPSASDRQTTAYAVTFTPADPNHGKTGAATLKLPPIVAIDEKEFALLPPVILTGLSATMIKNGQTLADSTISGTATAIDFGDVAGTFTWDSPATVPDVSVSERTAYAITFTPTDPNHGKTGTMTLKLPPIVVCGEKEFALLPPVTLTGLSATAITYGQTLAASTVSGTATTEDFGDVVGTFTWDSPTTAPSASDSQTTAYAVTFTPTDPNHSKTGSATVKLTVTAKPVTPAVTPSKASATYGDSGWNTLPTLTVTGDSKALTSGTDYTATWSPSSVTGPGTYTVTVTLQGDYSGSQTATYTVNPREVTLVWGPTAFTYTGSAQKPTCTAGNLVSGDSCTVTVSGEQVAAGTGYTATATGLSNANYKLPSATTTTFSISAKTITPTLTASKTSVKYGDSGWNTLPTLTVTDDSKTLASGTDYTAAWSPATPTGAGTYTVTVTLKGNYSGTQTATYTVDRRAVTLTSGTKQFFYDGQAHSNSTLKVSGDGFAAGEGVAGNNFATITEIGSAPNAFGYEFTGTGRAENYDVSCVQGTLTVIRYVEPSVEITKVSIADTYDGTYNYTYKVDGTFGDKEYDVLIKVSAANGTKSVVLTNESVTVGSVSTNVNVKTLFGKAYPNVMLFAELKERSPALER